MALSKQGFKILLKILALGAFFAVVIYLSTLAKENAGVQAIVSHYGYFGILFISFLSGLNLVVPIPAVTFMPVFLASGLDFLTTVCVISLGMVAADSFAYFVGHVGMHTASHLFEERHHSTLEYLRGLKHKYRFAPLVALFVCAALIPIPNEVLLVPMGILGYKFLKIIPILLVGNLIFNFLYSSGIINISELF